MKKIRFAWKREEPREPKVPKLPKPPKPIKVKPSCSICNFVLKKSLLRGKEYRTDRDNKDYCYNCYHKKQNERYTAWKKEPTEQKMENSPLETSNSQEPSLTGQQLP